jgi:hypothetical protein
MMSSLIAQIAGKHGLPRENLATEVFVYILESLDVSVVRELLAYYGVGGQGNSYAYRFEPQRKAADGQGIPDIQIKDDNEMLCGLMENKFDARLTGHQPITYLDSLPNGGVLLFIVPEPRRRQLFKQLLEKCRVSMCFQQITTNDARRTCALVDERRMEVTSWDEILNRLATLQECSQQPPEMRRKWLSDIEQLRRFCDVVDKETFEPFTPEQVRGIGISTVIHQLTWITTELINRCIERGIVVGMSESIKKGTQNAMRADVDSSLHYGQNLRFLGAGVWIGFWCTAWEERKMTPLWIEISPREPKGSDIARQIQRVKGADAVLRSTDGGWLIPIAVEPGRYQEEMVEDAVRFLSELKDIENQTQVGQVQ